ncbi:pyridoxamine 5'-phosphate oxidase family protein [Rhodobacteraceae bacterium]|nr:pyridoxamine 5'-phosphate oxidase family protein [Paracoccaceae bacterium]
MKIALIKLLDRAWNLLEEGQSDVHSPFRLTSLATIDIEGQPQARHVVLRAVNRASETLEFHTDRSSSKCAELQANPRAQLLFWDPNRAIQLRLHVRIALRQDAHRDAQWQNVPGPSQIAYGKTPRTGLEIHDAFAYELTPSRSQFMVCSCAVQKLEFLSLKEQHFRAVFQADDGWTGTWLSP